jgi:PPOX class probable F420-dependent enzyme
VTHRLTMSPELCALLDSPSLCVFATSGLDGLAQTSVVWVERRGEAVALFASPDTAKVRNIENDPRVVLTVIDPAREHWPGVPVYVRLTGVAEIHPPEAEMPHRLARFYGNPSGYPPPVDEFVTIVVRVERISGVGPFDQARLGGWLH